MRLRRHPLDHTTRRNQCHPQLLTPEEKLADAKKLLTAATSS
jgi:hypothetical protein